MECIFHQNPPLGVLSPENSKYVDSTKPWGVKLAGKYKSLYSLKICEAVLPAVSCVIHETPRRKTPRHKVRRPTIKVAPLCDLHKFLFSELILAAEGIIISRSLAYFFPTIRRIQTRNNDLCFSVPFV